MQIGNFLEIIHQYLNQFFRWIDSTIICNIYMKAYGSYVYGKFPMPYETFRIFFGSCIVLLLGFVVFKVKKGRKGVRYSNISISDSTDGRTLTRWKLYAPCSFCSKEVYMPFKCEYCGNYFCEDHILPPKHNCPNIESWKSKGSLPSGVVWEHKKGGTFYRKY